MDVTEQHEARAALQTAFEQIKAEEIELRRMTDAVASYIYVLRPDGTPLYANQTVLDYTGLTLEDVQREDQRARSSTRRMWKGCARSAMRRSRA